MQEEPMSATGLSGMHVPADAGETIPFLGTEITFKVTREMSRGAYTMWEQIAPPGTGVPLHIHHKDEETLLLLEGRLVCRIGEFTCDAGPGDVVHLPAGTPHAWRAQGDENARALLTASLAPGGDYEAMFRRLAEIGPEDLERLAAIAASNDIEIVLPPVPA
jgi:quercetin dioxygenase-like cupin family protein